VPVSFATRDVPGSPDVLQALVTTRCLLKVVLCLVLSVHYNAIKCVYERPQLSHVLFTAVL
jgi:hypothetical protein